MSSRLTYKIVKTEFTSDIRDSVQQAFNLDIGSGYVYPVIALFQVRNQWISPTLLLYDTGAMITLLPARFSQILNVQKYAAIIIDGVVPNAQLNANLCMVTMRLEDAYGARSPQINAWVAIAEHDDVPPVMGLKSIADTHRLIVDPERKEFNLEFY